MVHHPIGWESQVGQVIAGALPELVVAVATGIVLGVITQGLLSWRRLGTLTTEVSALRETLDVQHEADAHRLGVVEEVQREHGARLDEHSRQLAALEGRLGPVEPRARNGRRP